MCGNQVVPRRLSCNRWNSNRYSCRCEKTLESNVSSSDTVNFLRNGPKVQTDLNSRSHECSVLSGTSVLNLRRINRHVSASVLPRLYCVTACKITGALYWRRGIGVAVPFRSHLGQYSFCAGPRLVWRMPALREGSPQRGQGSNSFLRTDTGSVGVMACGFCVSLGRMGLVGCLGRNNGQCHSLCILARGFGFPIYDRWVSKRRQVWMAVGGRKLTRIEYEAPDAVRKWLSITRRGLEIDRSHEGAWMLGKFGRVPVRGVWLVNGCGGMFWAGWQGG